MQESSKRGISEGYMKFLLGGVFIPLTIEGMKRYGKMGRARGGFKTTSWAKRAHVGWYMLKENKRVIKSSPKFVITPEMQAVAQSFSQQDWARLF